MPDGLDIHLVLGRTPGRGDGVAYVGSTSLPVQPYDDEFHVHPCFRPSLHCAEAVPEPRTDVGVLVGASPHHARETLLRSTAASDAGFSPNRDARWLEEMERAGTRLLRHLARSGLPSHARREVAETVTNALIAADWGVEQLRRERRARLRTTVEVLEALAARLTSEG